MPRVNRLASRPRQEPVRHSPSEVGRRAMSMQCATCPSLAPCPTCAKGQMCQLSIPRSCSECPKNACVDDPSYKHASSSGSIGGGVGGVLAALLLAAVLFWFWRKRHQRAKEALRRARADAKVRLASSEKFRPGGGALKAKGIEGEGKASEEGASAATGAEEEQDDEEEDGEDVEWTELREDGLTMYRNKPGQDGVVENDAAALKRRSMGAATHLSRITEGAEDDEDGFDVENRLRGASRIRETIIEEADLGPSATSRESRGHSSSASIGSEQNRTRSRRSLGGRELVNPFADWMDAGSIVSGSSTTRPDSTEGSTAVCSSALEHGKWSAPTSLEPPSRVHRPVGAPLVDLQGKPKSTVFSQFSGTRSPSIREPLSPISPQQSVSPSMAPSRPVRMPDLNLRLEDGSEPGKIGDDLRKPQKTNANGTLSPVSPSSPSFSKFDNRRTTLELEASEIDDFPTELAKSDVYAKRYTGKGDNRRNSTLTTGTTGTMDTMNTFEYVMSAPQIVTPLAADGAKRVELKQGKALLVRSLSAIRREQEEQRERKRAIGSSIASSTFSTEYAASDNPFSDPLDSLQVQGAFGLNDTHHRPGDVGGEAGLSMGASSDLETSSLSPMAQRSLNASGRSLVLSGLSSRPHSAMSEASLPFVDRPMREPTDRSPTDAHARESIATLASSHRMFSRPSMSSELDVPQFVHSSSQRSSALSGMTRPYSHAHSVARQSGTSIGGLSVFDEIPFHIAEENREPTSPHVEISMPDETHARQQAPRASMTSSAASVASSAITMEIISGRSETASIASQSSLPQANRNPLFESLKLDIGGEGGGDHQPEASPFHDHHADARSAASSPTSFRQAYEARRTSVPVSLVEEPDETHSPSLSSHELPLDSSDRSSSLSDSNGLKVRQQQSRNAGTNPDFEQIRLRHELDNYPFTNDA